VNDRETILIIDDEAVIRQSFTYYLEDQDYKIITAENGRAGMEIIDQEVPHLVLTDLRMPEADGLEVLHHVNKNWPDIPVIVISGANKLDDAVQALRLGAWDYLIKPVHDLNLVGYTVRKALEKSALIKENRAYREHLEALVAQRTLELEKRNRQLEISRRQVIGILSQAAEYRDFETGNHFLRVSEFTGCIARGMGWDEERVQRIQLASPVHDIGKVGIPDNVLLKPGKLTPEEWEIMKEHCLYGSQILTTNKFIEIFCKIDNLSLNPVPAEEGFAIIETAAEIALYHHEYWNGQGYPTGRRGEDIPFEARITAVADVYDALSSQRPYKDPWPEEKCLSLIREKTGEQFDPQVVEVFLKNFDTIRLIQNTYHE
jgi:putative two-component system response regulator